MFYVLSKTFDILAMPLTLAFMMICYGVLTKNRLRAKRFIWTALVGLYLCSNPIIVNELLKWWEPSFPHTVNAQKVGVILLGGTIKKYDPVSGHIWLGNSSDRAAQAFQLYKEGKIQKIIISGGFTSITGQIASHSEENDGVRGYLLKLGVAAEDIVQESKSKNTRENALFSAKILREQFKTNECMLITSAFHLRRAVGCFDKVGITTTPYPAQFLQQDLEIWFDKLFPSEEFLHIFYTIWHEMIGYVVYKLTGYI
ncbi:MAG: YdcF family protein [Runella sp.]